KQLVELMGGSIHVESKKDIGSSFYFIVDLPEGEPLEVSQILVKLADCLGLIPEIPFRYESICAAIADREKIGKHFTLVIAAEGAKPAGGDFVTSGEQQQNREARLGGIGAVVAAEIEKRTGKETRVVVLGHLQRGGSPTNMDRALCTLFGAKAVDLIAQRKFGQMVTHTGTSVESVALSEAIGELRTVPLDGAYVRAARALGISLGD
ncbi:MAG: 6-phosphofructokinase, partial [Verrucomicrobia bacterium]|nr:6-phosphofructokinase [Verrucomicrobiota bacterium]